MGTTTVGLETVSRETKYSHGSVVYAIRVLKDLGRISKQQRSLDNRGGRKTAITTIHCTHEELTKAGANDENFFSRGGMAYEFTQVPEPSTDDTCEEQEAEQPEEAEDTSKGQSTGIQKSIPREPKVNPREPKVSSPLSKGQRQGKEPLDSDLDLEPLDSKPLNKPTKRRVNRPYGHESQSQKRKATSTPTQNQTRIQEFDADESEYEDSEDEREPSDRDGDKYESEAEPEYQPEPDDEEHWDVETYIRRYTKLYPDPHDINSFLYKCEVRDKYSMELVCKVIRYTYTESESDWKTRLGNVYQLDGRFQNLVSDYEDHLKRLNARKSSQEQPPHP